MKPFIAWVGGKTKLVSELSYHFPQSFSKNSRYLEPFIGGGALFLNFKATRSYPENFVWEISDLNAELINAWTCIRDCVETVIYHLHQLRASYSETHFYANRSKIHDLSNPAEAAALFIYLNKTSFGSLYRVNKDGIYNVPFAKRKNPNIFDPKHLRDVSKLLQGVVIKVANYEDQLRSAVKGDLVYLDPPYIPLNSTSYFTSYTPGGFNFADQQKLSELATDAVARGVHVVISNSNTPETHELYPGFEILEIASTRAINRDFDSKDIIAVGTPHD